MGTRFDPLEARTAAVGQELDVVLHAGANANLASVTWTSDIADLQTRSLRPSLTPYDGGESIFRWTPLAGDVGDHVVQFNADVGGAVASTRLQVTVIAGTGGPAFREPVGDGTTFDPQKTPCADVALLVDDTVATQVKLQQGEPWTANGTITQETPLSGRLRFCPSKDQQMQGTVYPFTLVATDESGARAIKRYTIVLGQLAVPPVVPSSSPTSTSCSTSAPAITHTPHGDITTAGNLHLYATIDAANGIYDAWVFWSTTAPPSPSVGPPDPSTMNPVQMSWLGGSSTSADFGATIPNPVVNDAPGTTQTIWYLLRSTDAADAVMGCAYNTTFSPSSGTYSFTVKRSTAP